MRAIYVHVHIYTDLRNYTAGHWRVFEGLLLKGGDPVSLPAEILFIDNAGAIRIEREAHLSNRCGAATWVYATEFEQLAKMVEDDWHRRGLWQEAYQDIQKIREARKDVANAEA